MKAIVVPEEKWDDAFRLMLLEVERSMRERGDSMGEFFRIVNFHIQTMKDRLEKP